MKKTKNYTGLILVCFFIAIVGVTAFRIFTANEQQSGLAASKIPLLRISTQDVNLTDLHGYDSSEAQDYAKSIVLPLDESKEADIAIGPNVEKMGSLTYKIYRKEDGTLVSEGKIKEFSKEDGYWTARLKVDDILTENIDYSICFTLSLPGQKKMYYYAKLAYGTDFHVKEDMEFAKQFHDDIFAKSENVINYIESEEDAADEDFSYTTIKSSYNSIIFGDIEPVLESDISYEIRKVEGQTVSAELTYIMSIQRSERSKQYYKVKESYEVAYGLEKERMYLMDYTRKIESLFNPEFIYSTRQEILLGITQQDAPDYIEADSGKKVAFVQGKQVWLFDYRKNTLTQVFAFNDTLNICDIYDYNNVKLLNLDEDGNIDFLVYGYMTRGEHEGQNGILMYHYDVSKCLLEEKIFIESNYKYKILNSGIQKVGQYDENGNLYLLLNNDLYKVTVAANKVEKVEEGIENENLAVSENGDMIAIQKEDETKKLTLWNLKTGEQNEITCKDSQQLKLIGFISEDCVYGVAREKDLPESGDTFPMKRICILNKEGEKIKTYKKENRYILSAKISGNVIRVTLGKKEDGKYKKIPLQEYIRYQGEETTQISFVRHSDTVQWSQLYIKFPSNIYLQDEPNIKKAGLLF